MRPVDRAHAIKDMTSFEWRGNASGKLDKIKGQHKLTFDKEPDYIYDKQGEIVGVDAWVRLFGADGKEVKIDPHRRIVNPPTVPRSGIVETGVGKDRSRELTPNPSEAFYEAVWDSVASTPNAKGWRTRGTVTTVYGDAADGFIQSSSEGYSGARSGGDLSADSTASVFIIGQNGDEGPGTSYSCFEGFVSFDTSAISDTDLVSNAVVDMYLTGTSLDINFICEAREKDWGASVTNVDWVAGASLGGLTLMATLNTSSMGSTGSYKSFSSETALLSATGMQTGTIYLLLSSSRHRVGNTPNSFDNENVEFSSSNVSGTTQDPKLSVTHEAPFTPSVPRFTQRPNRIWRLY